MGGASITAIRLVFFTGTLTTLIYMFVALRYFRDINVDASGNIEAFVPQTGSTCNMLATSVKDSRFWRLALFTLLILFVKLLFRHLDATYPKVGQSSDPQPVCRRPPRLTHSTAPHLAAASTSDGSWARIRPTGRCTPSTPPW